MDKRELEYWQSVTEHSTYRWTEDSIIRLNSGEHLYYIGGENGHYMRLSQDGKLTVGNYEGAYPHIGEAVFYLRAEHQYLNINEAFQAACQLGGAKFLEDLFSSNPLEQGWPNEPDTDGSMDFEMKVF